MDTCFQWKRLPSEFGLCAPEDDFGVMMAYTRTAATMQAWADQVQEDEQKKKHGVEYT